MVVAVDPPGHLPRRGGLGLGPRTTGFAGGRAAVGCPASRLGQAWGGQLGACSSMRRESASETLCWSLSSSIMLRAQDARCPEPARDADCPALPLLEAQTPRFRPTAARAAATLRRPRRPSGSPTSSGGGAVRAPMARARCGRGLGHNA